MVFGAQLVRRASAGNGLTHGWAGPCVVAPDSGGLAWPRSRIRNQNIGMNEAVEMFVPDDVVATLSAAMTGLGGPAGLCRGTGVCRLCRRW